MVRDNVDEVEVFKTNAEDMKHEAQTFCSDICEKKLIERMSLAAGYLHQWIESGALSCSFRNLV